MTSLIAKVALAATLTVATVVGLVGLSGFIIFADLKTPQPANLVQERLNNAGGGGNPVAFTGPN